MSKSFRKPNIGARPDKTTKLVLGQAPNQLIPHIERNIHQYGAAYEPRINNEDYLATMDSLRDLPVSVIHGGHFPSFGPKRYRQLINEYLTGKRMPDCHLTTPK